MVIRIRGASANNLKDISVDIGDELTVVAGISGSGKTSLVFDTLYHEARRRYLDVFAKGSAKARLQPADVREVTGVGPAVAVGQNLLNRNPLSTLATASGIHPFLRLLFTKFGERFCPMCGASKTTVTDDVIVKRMIALSSIGPLQIFVPIVRNAKGSHRTLLELLTAEFDSEMLFVDGRLWNGKRLRADSKHRIQILIHSGNDSLSLKRARSIMNLAKSLGALSIRLVQGDTKIELSWTATCSSCGHWLKPLEPTLFRASCPHCKGKGCTHCLETGLPPEAAAVRWSGLGFLDILDLSIDEALGRFSAEGNSIPSRLNYELTRRLDALHQVGLGYIQLNRPSPSLSRGESQRVRIAVSLVSQLEDMLHLLDEPTIGQHPADVASLLPMFLKLNGPVVFVEHDRQAAAYADRAIEIGPGPGEDGGQLVFEGTPAELWRAATHSGEYFSQRADVHIPEKRDEPTEFLTVGDAWKHNLKGIDVRIPIGRFTVISGVSGSGKSTLVEHVLVPSLKKQRPIGCERIKGPKLKPIFVDQSPIGNNPRSNPATYTKLADVFRDFFAKETGLSASHFSFNRSEGACSSCKGMGALEVKMKYLPSTWITCSACDGKRFSDDVLSARAKLGGRELNIAELYDLSISEVSELVTKEPKLDSSKGRMAAKMLDALVTIGLGYLKLGQESPTLSGGEAERVKLAKYLGRMNLSGKAIILDEPSSGLHPKDLTGLLAVIDRLVRTGATIVVVEHNTDVIRSADWIVDLGYGAGPLGGEVVYQGSLDGIFETESLTGKALTKEHKLSPRSKKRRRKERADAISIRKATANNLQDVSVKIPKGKLTVITGPSGCGKTSLVRDVLEAEAQRRFLETLSLYERQSIKEGPEAPVESVTGLGVSVSITPQRRRYDLRATVATVTEIASHLAVLLSLLGERICLECGSAMVRKQKWECPLCDATSGIAKPKHFSTRTYSAACKKCHGVGSHQKPMPEKLIINPEKPICAGAMYSPGFFPKGYICKPYNGGYYIVQAIAKRYGFDPAVTPWNQMTKEAQDIFLYGDKEPIEVTFENRSGKRHTRKTTYPGFYGWIRDWDVGGAYTRSEPCKDCEGSGFRPEIRAVSLNGVSVQNLGSLTLDELYELLGNLEVPEEHANTAGISLSTILTRIQFLQKVGLGYLTLNQVAGTLSAGEAQRAKLASLLGSGLQALTVLFDEPTRGMHPSEVDALTDALKDLRTQGNTVVVVEHDLSVIRAADIIVDMGPKSGVEGGKILAVGTPNDMVKKDTVTSRWLRGEEHIDIPSARRTSKEKLIIRRPNENNLQVDKVEIPKGILVGICGPSGSGKSTLIVDTLGRALSPKKITTSVAYEPIQPGKHERILNAPEKALILDQTRRGIRSPGQYLGILPILSRIYTESEDAIALGLSKKDFSSSCSQCEGQGYTRTEMGFLPSVNTLCDACDGTGLTPEAARVSVEGIAYSEVGRLTIDQACKIFKEDEALRRKFDAARSVGLGYLVLHQPSHTLSGGEIQRLRIADELSKRTSGFSLYIWDEPSLGQHLSDIKRLIRVLRAISEEGHSVIIIEHHPHILAACDWLIELGPGGGPDGGKIVAEGTPEMIASGESRTAPYLKQVLEGSL